jgi:hypothetical protein
LKYSAFANPAKGERRQYAVYWQNKLAPNKEVDFPNELLDQFADQTDKFSFAYMKEVLSVHLPKERGRHKLMNKVYHPC